MPAQEAGRSDVPVSTTPRGSSPRLAGQRLVARPQPVEIGLGQLLQVKQRVMGALHRANQLVQPELHGLAVAVPGVLDQKDHEKGHDRGAGVDHQLPGVAEAKEGADDGPAPMRALLAGMGRCFGYTGA